MNQSTLCNACLEMFVVERKDIATVTDGDLEIQYFSCPRCGEKYIVLVTDSEMRKLIGTAVKVAKMLRLAHVKKFRADEIRKYERVLAITKQRQEKIAPELKKRGYAILKEEAAHEPEK